MFNLFRKNDTIDNNIYSPVNGYCTDIAKCKDNVFASKMMGDGFMIEPTSNIIKSTCNGTVQMIFPSKHAIGVTMHNGQEIMIHIGIDTVKLNGNGFKQLIKPNSKVKVGTPLIELDMNYLQSQNIDMSVLVVLTNDIEKPYKKENLERHVETSTKIIKRE